MKTKSIAFIGGGRITRIFLRGFGNKGLEFQSVLVYDTNPEVLKKLQNDFPFIKTENTASAAASAEIVFIALHPPVIGETLPGLKQYFDPSALLISLAPKFSIQKIAGMTGTNRIIRMIPNATSFINAGYNPVCFSDAISIAEKGGIMEFLSLLGFTFETAENKLEAYAIASAMLPTYFWFQWKEMEKLSLQMGLSEKESRDAIFETLKAALELQYNSGLSYEEVTDLIPVKPVGENEPDIKNILNTRLLGLFEKLKP